VLSRKAKLDSLSDTQKQTYKSRLEGFIADSESNESVIIQFDNDPAGVRFILLDEQRNSETDRNGNLEGVLQLTKRHATDLLEHQQSNSGWLSFHVVSDNHAGLGQVRLIPNKGISVVSDIDDTVKNTGITKGQGVVLANTFFKPFEAVPCMAELYSEFDDKVSFHYVSGAPWQLYGPLTEFLFNGVPWFPMGSMHMKNVRTNLSEPESISDSWKLIADGSKQVTYEQKIEQITQLITHFPERQFVLIGDSGERDPEVFAQIRKRFPENIKNIVIRNVDNDVDAGSSATGCPAVDLLAH